MRFCLYNYSNQFLHGLCSVLPAHALFKTVRRVIANLSHGVLVKKLKSHSIFGEDIGKSLVIRFVESYDHDGITRTSLLYDDDYEYNCRRRRAKMHIA